MLRRIALIISLVLVVGVAAVSVLAATDVDWSKVTNPPPVITVPEHILGKTDAPVTVEEYVSLTCPHCADFYNKTLPELEPKYVATGKVRFILRDYPLDGSAMKAAALARCMPDDAYYPFIKTLYKNLIQWAVAANQDQVLIQYAKFAGLTEEKAKSCLNDQAMQDAVVAERTAATDKFKINATPTFIINYGAEKFEGDRSPAEFSAVFDRLLAAKK